MYFVVYSFFLGMTSIWRVKNGSIAVKVKHFRPSLGLVHQHPFMIGKLELFTLTALKTRSKSL
jgi:hypothetical protein